MAQLSDKVVAITGAASGIGRATAVLAAERGARIAAGDWDRAGLDELTKLAADRGWAMQTVQLDVADEAAVTGFIDGAIAEFGALHGLMTCAGITSPVPAIEMEPDEFRRILDVNLLGTFLCVRQAVRAMVRAGTPGSVVTVSSALALTGQRNGVHYAASKAGVIGLTKTFALEQGDSKIRFNNIAPGATESPLLRRTVSDEFLEAWAARAPLGRIGQPEDHATCACFLLSDDSSWITGQTFHVNGGSIMP
jgi:NAD(P)-dependent dehydrogenase (short-subunit alcohol dehydrogenase family)